MSLSSQPITSIWTKLVMPRSPCVTAQARCEIPAPHLYESLKLLDDNYGSMNHIAADT